MLSPQQLNIFWNRAHAIFSREEVSEFIALLFDLVEDEVVLLVHVYVTALGLS